MKNFTFLLLMLCTPSFFGLQAMGPDYGDLKYREKKDHFSIHSANKEDRDFLFDEEHAALLKIQISEEQTKALKKHYENEILEEFIASVQESKTETNYNQLSNDDNDEEIARFAAAYKARKENKSLIKKTVHFCLPDNLSPAKALSRENKNNHQFAALCIGNKQQRHTESPIALFVAAGKESPFSETTTPSLSPIHVEEEFSDTENTSGDEDNMFPME